MQSRRRFKSPTQMERQSDLAKGRQRPSVKRVKSGCRTCKNRKIKCDESRPSCRKCIVAGRTCDGYGVWDGVTSRGSFVALPQSAKTHGTIARYIMPSLLADLDYSERRAFAWLIHRTLVKVPGLFPSAFWHTLVPQISMNRRCVLHAALALASGHEGAMLAAPDRLHSTSVSSAQERFSLQQYNKAITCLMPLLGTEDGDATDMILIVCLLFSCLELLNGHYKTGQVHLQAAFELARKGLATHKSPTANSTFGWLSEVVGRLALQSYLLESNALKLQNMEALQRFSIPTSSASLNRARLPMDRLLHKAYTLRQWELDNPGPTDAKAKDWLMSVKQATQSELDAWPSLYLPHEKDLNKQLSPRELLGFQILRIYHTVAHILVGSVGHDLGECVFDDYASDFESILEGTADILVASEAMRHQDVTAGLNSQSLNFTMDLGLIPPVYFTALKCRLPHVRRRATALLAHSLHQEGIWNGKMAAIVAEKVMDIEESSVTCHTSQHSNNLYRDRSHMSAVSENCRIVDVHAELPNLPHGVLVMECRQRRLLGGWDTIRKNYDLNVEMWDS